MAALAYLRLRKTALMEQPPITISSIQSRVDPFLTHHKSISAMNSVEWNELESALYRIMLQSRFDDFIEIMTHWMQVYTDHQQDIDFDDIRHIQRFLHDLQTFFSPFESCIEFFGRYSSFMDRRYTMTDLDRFTEQFVFDRLGDCASSFNSNLHDDLLISWFANFYQTHGCFEDFYYETFQYRMSALSERTDIGDVVKQFQHVCEFELSLLGKKICGLSQSFLDGPIHSRIMSYFFHEYSPLSIPDLYRLIVTPSYWTFMDLMFESIDDRIWTEYIDEKVGDILTWLDNDIDRIVIFAMCLSSCWTLFDYHEEDIYPAWRKRLYDPNFRLRLWDVLVYGENSICMSVWSSFLEFMCLCCPDTPSSLLLFIQSRFFSSSKDVFDRLYHRLDTLRLTLKRRFHHVLRFLSMNRLSCDIMMMDDFEYCHREIERQSLDRRITTIGNGLFHRDLLPAEIVADMDLYERQMYLIIGMKKKIHWHLLSARVTISEKNMETELDFIPFYFLCVWRCLGTSRLSELYKKLSWPKELFDDVMYYWTRTYPCVRIDRQNGQQHLRWLGLGVGSSVSLFSCRQHNKMQSVNDTKRSIDDIHHLIDAHIVSLLKKRRCLDKTDVIDNVHKRFPFIDNQLIEKRIVSLEQYDYISIQENDEIHYIP